MIFNSVTAMLKEFILIRHIHSTNSSVVIEFSKIWLWKESQVNNQSRLLRGVCGWENLNGKINYLIFWGPTPRAAIVSKGYNFFTFSLKYLDLDWISIKALHYVYIVPL